jgi:hypothetical protein
MADWTRARVEERLESAAEVMRALPSVKPQGHFSAWPAYFHTFADKVGQEPEMRRPRPSPRAITEAEEAMLWLRRLEPELAKLVWAGASGTEWKPICWQFGISRPTAAPPVGMRAQRHRLAAERPARADEAVASKFGGGGAGRVTIATGLRLPHSADSAPALALHAGWAQALLRGGRVRTMSN